VAAAVERFYRATVAADPRPGARTPAR
jgi:hypothetical protein